MDKIKLSGSPFKLRLKNQINASIIMIIFEFYIRKFL